MHTLYEKLMPPPLFYRLAKVLMCTQEVCSFLLSCLQHLFPENTQLSFILIKKAVPLPQ